MSPAEYEHHVAALLAAEGWQARVTPTHRDFGLDIICDKPNRRLGVQVKMYGDGMRSISGQMIMQLHGAAALEGCTETMLVTNGRVLPEAEQFAQKLEIEVRFEEVPESLPNPRATGDASGATAPLTFDAIWEEQVMPLVGSELVRKNGTTNKILSVDWTGLKRRTSNGKTQIIDIEVFRWAIERMLDGETVLRGDINDQFAKRASSGIKLILESLPAFEEVEVGRKKGIRLRREQ